MPNSCERHTICSKPSFFRLFGLVSALTVAAAWPMTSAQAGGGLMVSPTRVELDGRTRSSIIYLINNSTEANTYRLSLVNCRMSDDGRIAEVDKLQSGESSAEKLVTFSPREVVLPPGTSQTVRLQVRKPANLPTGEYRSHLKIQEIPPPETGYSLNEATDKQNRRISVKLDYVFSTVLPVIVRHGETAASLQLSDARLLRDAQGGRKLTVKVNRNGNRSLYGTLKTSFIPQHGREQVLSQTKGLAVYCPNKDRRFEVPLVLPKDLALQNGRLRVSFTDDGAKASDAIELSTAPMSE